MYYILDKNKNPVAVECLQWGKWLEENDRRVRHTELKKHNASISTVFLGLDHGFSLDKSHVPLIFETMIFWPGQELDQYQERYFTWNEAVVGHRDIVRLVINEIRIQLRDKL